MWWVGVLLIVVCVDVLVGYCGVFCFVLVVWGCLGVFALRVGCWFVDVDLMLVLVFMVDVFLVGFCLI